MAVFHKGLNFESWSRFSSTQQILNIASELNRAKNWVHTSLNNTNTSIERAFELIDLTIDDRAKWQKGNLKELLRFREVLAYYYIKEVRTKEELKKIIKVLLEFEPSTSTVVII